MYESRSDSLVFFGATGDLAFKKIFPALQAMVKHDSLEVPVIGVARPDWTIDQFKARVLDSLESHGGVDTEAYEKLSGQLRYVSGDYSDAATYERLKKTLGGARRPAHYLAIPPTMFEVVVGGLGRSGCAEGARVLVEKPFGRNLASAKKLNRILQDTFEESEIFRIDHYLGKRPVNNLQFFRYANTFFGPIWNSDCIESVQVTLAEEFGVQGRGGFYEEAGAVRDVIQNHLFQVVTNLAMDLPAGIDSESMRNEKVAVLNAIPPVDVQSFVRGQYIGYLDEAGVAPDSTVETYAAMRLTIDTPRWRGVPFYVRAGKHLPVTCTEVVVRLHQPQTPYPNLKLKPNVVRLRISPQIIFSLRMNVLGGDEQNPGQEVEMVAYRHRLADERSPYERVLRDALQGDLSLFARQDYTEEAWRIVDPVLKADTPIHAYEPNTWGPAHADQIVSPPGGWQNPTTAGTIDD